MSTISKETQKLYDKYEESIHRGDYKKAIECLDTLIEINTDNPCLWYNKGSLYYNLKYYDKAIDSFNKAIELDPEYTSAYNNQGLAYCNKHEFDKAIDSFNKAINYKPEYTSAYNNQGLAYYYQGRAKNSENDYFRAIECFDKAIDIIGTDNDTENNNILSNAWNNKGNVLFKLGWIDSAINCIDKALNLNSENENAWNNRGYILSSFDRDIEAIKYYDKAIELNPQHAEAWNNKGNALSNLLKYREDIDEDYHYYEEAIECYDKALECSSDSIDAVKNKAILLTTHNENKTALRLVKEWSRKNNHNKDTKDIEGLIYINLKRYDEALICFDEIISKDKSAKTAWYHKGNIKLKQKEYDIAIKCYNEALRIDPLFAEAHNSKAVCYYNKQEYEKAAKEANKAMEIKPSLVIAKENYIKLSIPPNENNGNHSFWDFWNSSWSKKTVAILLGLTLAMIISITVFIPDFMKSDYSVVQKPEMILPIIGIVLLILLIPEIKKAKVGPMELELKEFNFQPVKNISSLTESLD